MYQILNGIFGRELNENYRANTKSNLAGTVADIGNYLDARKNDKRNEARKDLYYNNMRGGGNGNGDTISVLNGYRGSGGLGVDEGGMFRIDGRGNKVYDTQQSGGIGADANGVYGVDGVTPQTNAPTFSGGNNFDWGKASPIPKENSAMDYWNNSRPNNVMFQGQQSSGGDSLGKLLTTSGLDILTGKDGGTFSSVLNGFGGLLGGSGSNPYQPSNSSNNSAQGIGGQNNVSANDLSRYLGDEYNRGRWIQDDYEQRGVNDPVISMLRYDTKIAPLVQRAREDRVKDLFMRSNNPNLSDEERMEARLQLSGELQDPEFIDKMEYNKWKRQKERDEWDLDRISKGIKNQAAQESLENNRILADLASAFPDGQIYKVNMGSGYADEGLKNTNPELVQGLDILNTFVRNRFGKDLTVTGGARTKEHNASVNGDSNSHHLYGEAVDLVDSGLTPEQQEEVVKFAKAIGFTAAKYHDAGSGMHLHVALDKKSHLKGLNIGKGKTLTVGQMLGQTTKNGKTVKDDGSLNLSYDYEQTLNSMIRKFSSAPDSADGMVGLAKTLAPLYADIEKQSNSETAKKKIHNYVKKIANEGVKKGEEINESYISTVVANTVAQAKNGNNTDKSGEKKEETKNGLIDKSKTVSGQTREGGTPPSNPPASISSYRDSDEGDLDENQESGYNIGGASVSEAIGNARLKNINSAIEQARKEGKFVDRYGNIYTSRDLARMEEERRNRLGEYD